MKVTRLSLPKSKFMQQSALVRRREIKGLFYVLPFILGFFFLLIVPIAQSLIYSFSKLEMGSSVDLTSVGLDNYKRLLFEDTELRQILLPALGDMALNVPIILIFSLLIAAFMNKLPGGAVFQLIFFIPVILSAGIIPGLMHGDLVRLVVVDAGSDSGSIFNFGFLEDFLRLTGMGGALTGVISYAIHNIFKVLNSSGIQILVFYMALKSIPASLYEASDIEGATAWEAFWKITFPMVLPQFVVNAVYSIIDSFANSNNAVIRQLHQINFKLLDFGFGASAAWFYFAIIIAILAFVILILTRIERHYSS